nr:hypothetical protein [Tanacetum cinerariifolium]
LIQHLESIKKSIDERVQLKREYDSWVNERQMPTTKEKVDTSQAFDASSVDTKSRQQHTEQPEFNNEREVVQNVTTHYLPKEREAAPAKPHHMIASSNFKISSKNMPRFTSNDMVHNHYLEEAKKKIQECSRNSEPSLMPSARSKITANCSKPMPRRNTQTSRNWPASKNSFVTTKTVPIAEHSRNSSSELGLHDHSNKQSSSKLVSDMSVANNISVLVPQRQKASDYDNPDPVPQRQDVYSLADADDRSQQELDMLFSPLYDEFFNAGSNPSTNIQSTSAPSTHTNVNAEENNNDQAEEGEHITYDEFDVN